MTTTLVVILVNYKHAYDTIECIESLRKSSFQDFEIIVIDNASRDGSVETLHEKCPGVDLIASDTNLGFAEGNNLGIRYALAQETPYVLLLNNDTIVEPTTLNTLLQHMARNTHVGIVGGKILYENAGTPSRVWFAGGKLDVHSALATHPGLGEPDEGQYDGGRECDFVTGCCMLVRREVFERVGLLDSAYFAYYEDADFCLRAAHAGFKSYYEPRAVVYHKVSSTSTWDSPVFLYFNLRNKIFFLRRHSDLNQILWRLPYFIYFYTRQLLRMSLKRRSWDGTRAVLYGLIDGIRNYTGDHGKGRLDLILRKPV